jgi:hypothetical protein
MEHLAHVFLSDLFPCCACKDRASIECVQVEDQEVAVATDHSQNVCVIVHPSWAIY